MKRTVDRALDARSEIEQTLRCMDRHGELCAPDVMKTLLRDWSRILKVCAVRIERQDKYIKKLETLR